MGAQCYNFNVAFQGADSIYPRLVGRQIPGTLMEAALKLLCIWCWITVYPGFPLLGHLVIGSVLMCQIKNNKKKNQFTVGFLQWAIPLGWDLEVILRSRVSGFVHSQGHFCAFISFPAAVFCLPMDNAQTLPFFKTNLLFANAIHVSNASWSYPPQIPFLCLSLGSSTIHFLPSLFCGFLFDVLHWVLYTSHIYTEWSHSLGHGQPTNLKLSPQKWLSSLTVGKKKKNSSFSWIVLKISLKMARWEDFTIWL